MEFGCVVATALTGVRFVRLRRSALATRSLTAAVVFLDDDLHLALGFLPPTGKPC